MAENVPRDNSPADNFGEQGFDAAALHEAYLSGGGDALREAMLQQEVGQRIAAEIQEAQARGGNEAVRKLVEQRQREAPVVAYARHKEDAFKNGSPSWEDIVREDVELSWNRRASAPPQTPPAQPRRPRQEAPRAARPRPLRREADPQGDVRRERLGPHIGHVAGQARRPDGMPPPRAASPPSPAATPRTPRRERPRPRPAAQPSWHPFPEQVGRSRVIDPRAERQPNYNDPPDPFAQSRPLQERVLLAAMARKLNNAATDYRLEHGVRTHSIADLSVSEMASLRREYAKDPKEPLAWIRESLLNISMDTQLSTAQKERRLDHYLDAYCSLTIALDRVAFPPTRPGAVRMGVPDYIPHGFNDMGSADELDPSLRGREMIHVNKTDIFRAYRPVLKELFTRNYSGMSLTEKKRSMAGMLAQNVYFKLPYKNKRLGGGKVNLADLSEGVCRHQALVFQTLAQAAGLKSLPMKCDVEFLDEGGSGPHAANFVRIDNEWRLLDVTNPDSEMVNGQAEWRSGSARIDRPPRNGEARVYDITMRRSGKRRRYTTRNNMFWTIDSTQQAA